MRLRAVGSRQTNQLLQRKSFDIRRSRRSRSRSSSREKGGLRRPPLLLYGDALAKKACVGFVFDVAADVLLAGAHAPPVGKTCPWESVASQLVFTNRTPKQLPIGC